MSIKKVISAAVFCGCFSLIPLISGCAAEEAEEPVSENEEMPEPDMSGDEEGAPPALE